MKYLRHITVCILIIFSLLLLFIFKKDKLESDIAEAYISIDKSNLIKIENDNWEYLSSQNLYQYEWNKFDVYNGGEYLGNYFVQFNEKWYIFDDENNSIKYNDLLFMVKGTKVEMMNFEFLDVEDDDLVDIYTMLNNFKIKYDNDMVKSRKTYVDIDDDNVDEEIFVVYNDDENSENLFSFVYIVKNNKKIFIEKNIQYNKDYFNMPYYNVDLIMKLGNDNSYKIFVYKYYFSSIDENCYSVYEFKDDKLTTLLESELVYDKNENINTNEHEEINVGTIVLTFSLLGGMVGIVILMFYLKQKANNEI